MINPIEIAKILKAQKSKKSKTKFGFDSALLGLGIQLKDKKEGRIIPARR